MLFRLPKKQFSNALSNVERVTPKASSNPALSVMTIQVSSEDNTVVMRGGGAEIDLEVTLQADVGRSGFSGLPTTVFSKVVKNLPGELVEVKLLDDEHEIEIQSEDARTRLQLANSDLLITREFKSEYAGSLNATELSVALSSVNYATALAEYQQIFRGVKLELSDKGTRAVATDGFRLAYYHIDEPSGLDKSFVLPGKYVSDVIAFLKGEDEVKMDADEAKLYLQFGAYKVGINLMEGTFPDYSRIIPSNFPVTMTVDAQDLLEIVARASVMADKTSNNRIDFEIDEGTLHVESVGAYGRSQETLMVNQEGSEAKFNAAYNASYLVDALSPLKGQVRLSLSGRTSPTVVVAPDKPEYFALVVPLNID